MSQRRRGFWHSAAGKGIGHLVHLHAHVCRGLETIKRCKSIFLEAYTSILAVDKAELEALYGHEVIVADRQLVESDAERIICDAKEADVAFCVVGDPFGATTHTDLHLRAHERGVEVLAASPPRGPAMFLQRVRCRQVISSIMGTD